MRVRTFFASTLVVLISAALPIGTASAKTFTVPCSTPALITAINNANNEVANPGKDNINLTAGCTYVLTAPDNTDGDGPNGLPVITSIVNIIGNGATISRDSSAPSFRIMKVDTGGVLTTTSLILQNGLLENTGIAGGGILNRGSADLTSTSLRNNVVDVSGTPIAVPVGGAVANTSTGTFSMTFGDVTGNHAGTSTVLGPPGALFSIPLGGGVANGGALTVNQTTFSNNDASASAFFAFAVGGGIASGGNPSATLQVKGAKLLNNTVATFGIANAAIGGAIGANTLSMTGTEIGNNQAVALGLATGTAVGGGLATFGSTSVAKSSNIHDNQAGALGGLALGGGVANTADLTIVSSTVTNNNASVFNGDARGGGIQTTGSLNLSGSTVTGNTVVAPNGAAQGAGVYNGLGATAIISGSSISGNTATGATPQGGGIYNAGPTGAVTIPGSVVASNTPDNCAPAGSVPGCTG